MIHPNGGWWQSKIGYYTWLAWVCLPVHYLIPVHAIGGPVTGHQIDIESNLFDD
jgi:hypothetical protein